MFLNYGGKHALGHLHVAGTGLSNPEPCPTLSWKPQLFGSHRFTKGCTEVTIPTPIPYGLADDVQTLGTPSATGATFPRAKRR
jgi:hypothetical protein